MQQFVRSVTERFAEKLFVQFRHGRIVVRLAERLAFIFAVDRVDARLPDPIVGETRLPAAADATARAGHDFDEVVLFLAGRELAAIS